VEFLAPLMLLGAAGAAIPIAIHLIGRQRAPTVRFAAIDFLLGSDRKVARRLRLRELALLAARVLVCISIPLALAKPFTSCATDGPVIARGPQATVIIIDNALPAAYELDGQPLIARARARAKQLLSAMGPEADVALVATAEGARTPEALVRNPLQLRDAIAALRAEPRPGDLSGALGRAGALLAASDHEQRHIFVLSTLPAASVGPEPPAWPAGVSPEVTFIDPSAGVALADMAVVDVEVEPDPAAGSRGVRVTAELFNGGAVPFDDREVLLRIAGQVSARGAISLRPGERSAKRFATVLPPGARVADVVVELAPDALRANDRFFVRAELRDQVRTLLVNGDPRTVRHDDELFYLEAALRPGDRADSGVSLTTTTVDDLPNQELASYDAVILANTPALDAALVERLATWVDRGGGLLIAVGDRVEADAYNARMAPLLPQELRDPVDTTYGARGRERRERAERLAKLETGHPVLAIFRDQAEELLDARFETIALLGPTTRVDKRRVVARYTNGAAALIEAQRGDGRLMLFTSTLDRDWNDLPIHPGYLPLVQRAVRYLARKQADARRATALVGRRYPIDLPPKLARLTVEGPGGGRTEIEGERLAGRDSIAFAATDTPGFYRVSFADARGREARSPEADFAINIDPRAQDLSRADAPPLPTTSPPGTRAEAPEQHRRRVELWHALAAALLALMLLEAALVARGS
jgi:hypothetical protein